MHYMMILCVYLLTDNLTGGFAADAMISAIVCVPFRHSTHAWPLRRRLTQICSIRNRQRLLLRYIQHLGCYVLLKKDISMKLWWTSKKDKGAYSC